MVQEAMAGLNSFRELAAHDPANCIAMAGSKSNLGSSLGHPIHTVAW